ncbi:MAG: ankyrin repeat domain-containing protein [Pseudanabaena sp.]
MLFKCLLFSTSLFIGLLILNGGCSQDRHGICKDPNKIRKYVERGGDPNRHEDVLIYGNWSSMKLSPPLLGCAVQNGDLSLVQFLVSKGADVNGRDDITGHTPLHYLAFRFVGDPSGSYEIAKFLTDKGADVNAKDFDGNTPLHLVPSHWSDVAELLINRGANVNAQNKLDQTPLYSSVSSYCRTEVSKLLLAAKAEVNTKDFIGSTPLHYAVGSNCVESVAMLVDAGADVDAKDNKGISPFIQANKKYQDATQGGTYKEGGKTYQKMIRIMEAARKRRLP